MHRAVLSDQNVERLQECICKPLRSVESDHDTIGCDALDQIQNTPVLNEALHPYKDLLRINAIVEVPDIHLYAPTCAIDIAFHPFFNGPDAVMCSTIPNGPTAVVVHSSHHDRLQYLNQRMMHVLVRPESRFVYVPPFSCIVVISSFLGNRRWNESVCYDLSQIGDTFRSSLLYPERDLIRFIRIVVPPMRFIYFVDCFV